MFNDSEAHVVAALMACKTYADWSAAAKLFQKLYGKTIIMYMASFLEGSELGKALHAGKSIIGELERLYGSEEKAEQMALKYFNTGITTKDRFQTQSATGRGE
jgi:hypothetical protein